MRSAALIPPILLLVSGCAVDLSGTGSGDGGGSDVDGGGTAFDGGPTVDGGGGTPDSGSDCPAGTVDADGDPTNGCECTLAEPPLETCNGVDDDCDGAIDDAVEPQTCGTVGTCSEGTRTCAGGAFGDCVPLVPPTPEVCGGGDENCDGVVDEGCECIPGETRPCGPTMGACVAGTQACDAGTWGTACVGGTGPAMETCNGVDDDCDGVVDGVTRACGSTTGICTPGTETCTGGSFGACIGGVMPRAETCDAARLDENCDGTENEGCACDAGDTISCGSGTCTGVRTCDLTGTYGPCAISSGVVETCNGLDDDCNGTIDDGAADCAGATGCLFARSGGHAYLFCDSPLRSWTDAQAFCSSLGYHLVVVETDSENGFLHGYASMLSNIRAWIGFRDVDGDGTFEDGEWVTGSSSYRNWGSGQPNGSDGDCIAIRTDASSTWYDRGCGSADAAYICEAP